MRSKGGNGIMPLCVYDNVNRASMVFDEIHLTCKSMKHVPQIHGMRSSVLQVLTRFRCLRLVE